MIIIFYYVVSLKCYVLGPLFKNKILSWPEKVRLEGVTKYIIGHEIAQLGTNLNLRKLCKKKQCNLVRHKC